MPTASLSRPVKSWSLCLLSKDSMKRAPLKSSESATCIRSSGTPSPAPEVPKNEKTETVAAAAAGRSDAGEALPRSAAAGWPLITPRLPCTLRV